jgi:hypothetical protein
MFRVMIGKVGEPLIASQPHPHHRKMDSSGHFEGVNACTYLHTTFLLTDMAPLRSLQISCLLLLGGAGLHCSPDVSYVHMQCILLLVTPPC